VIAANIKTGKPPYPNNRRSICGNDDRRLAAFFFTWNQSRNEYIGENGRIYVDKMRRYKSEQLIQIATNFKLSRFYDKQKTLDQFGLDCTIVKDDPKDFKRGRKKKGENTLNKEKDE
jgi:hypothetical protein